MSSHSPQPRPQIRPAPPQADGHWRPVCSLLVLEGTRERGSGRPPFPMRATRPRCAGWCMGPGLRRSETRTPDPAPAGIHTPDPCSCRYHAVLLTCGQRSSWRWRGCQNGRREPPTAQRLLTAPERRSLCTVGAAPACRLLPSARPSLLPPHTLPLPASEPRFPADGLWFPSSLARGRPVCVG